jgi:hypothetical protein
MSKNIVRFDGENGIEILINTQTGESFASVRQHPALKYGASCL